MSTEAGVTPAKPNVAKPVRNPLTGNEAAEAAAKKAATTPVKPKPDIAINRVVARKAKDSHLNLPVDGHKCAQVEYWLPVTHEYEDLLNPLYWSSLVHRFKRPISTEGDYAGSIICVRPRDHSFYAELYVTEVSSGAVFTEQLFKKNFGEQMDEIKSDRFKVVWNDSVGGYDIMRKLDNAIVGNAKDFKRLRSVKSWLEKMEG